MRPTARWLVGEPDLHEFGGASGIALALASFAALLGFDEGGRMRLVGAVVITLVGAKLVAEFAGWQFHDWQSDGFFTVTLSHGIGVVVGGTWYLVLSWQQLLTPGPPTARETQA